MGCLELCHPHHVGCFLGTSRVAGWSPEATAAGGARSVLPCPTLSGCKVVLPHVVFPCISLIVVVQEVLVSTEHGMARQSPTSHESLRFLGRDLAPRTVRTFEGLISGQTVCEMYLGPTPEKL